MPVYTAGESSQLQDLKSRREHLQKEYSNLLFQVTASFVQSLVPETYTGQFVTDSASHLQNIGDLPTLDKVEESAVWDVVARLGWYREFVRLVRARTPSDKTRSLDINPSRSTARQAYQAGLCRVDRAKRGLCRFPHCGG